jgi:hypothetical protein
MQNLNALAEILHVEAPSAHVQYAISIFCNDVAELAPPLDEFVFQPIFKAYSEHYAFYKVDKMGIPAVIPAFVQKTSHGLIHGDHRLLSYGTQELSIVTSCSLLDTNVFAPPFNKYNDDTVRVCMQHGVQLQRFSDGWRSAEHNHFDPNIQRWYLHSREWDEGKLKAWLQCS